MTTAIQNMMSRVAQLQSMTRAAPGFDAALRAASSPAPVRAGMTSPTTRPTSTTMPESARQWAGSIERHAASAGVDPKLLTALVWTESSFSPTAVSSAGAIGLTQLMPPTAELLGVDPYDPEQNLAGGARYLREMLDRFGRTDLALAAYNAGPTRVATAIAAGTGDAVARGYVETVFARYRVLGGTQ